VFFPRDSASETFASTRMLTHGGSVRTQRWVVVYGAAFRRMYSMKAMLLCFFVLVFAQSDTRAPEGQRVVLTASAKGVQIYACRDSQWVFQAPEANLFDSSGKEIGTHSAGPVWTLRDGRSVKGTLVAKSDAPGKGDIPWLLLKGEGSFEYIRRSETQGGVAPVGACATGKSLRVDYSAVYTFYSSR
jgi:hypothetical protein